MKHRRTILKVIALLLAWGAAGAALNVAVAWGWAILPGANMFALPSDYVRTQYEDGAMLDGMTFRNSAGSQIVFAYSNGKWTPRPDRDDIAAFIDKQPSFAKRPLLQWFGSIDAPTPPSNFICLISRGWPLRSLYSIEEIDSSRDQPGTRNEFIDRGAIVIPMMSRPSTGHAPFYAIALPCLPVWPGFAINTLFYAGVLWMLFCVPFALRRMIRRRRGRCPGCNYPIGQSPVCTECGAPHSAVKASS